MLRFEIHPGLSRSQSRRHCEALKLAAGTEAGFYNEKLLDYLHFVFCLCLVERLLLTRKGRELFPVTTKAGALHCTYIVHHVHKILNNDHSGLM